MICLHTMVRLRRTGEEYAVRGTTEEGTCSGVSYVLRDARGNYIQASEQELEELDGFEAPFRFYEIVRLRPTRSAYRHMAGTLAIVGGISVDDGTRRWGFSVTLQGGEGYFFFAEELETTGAVLPTQLQTILQSGRRVRVLVDPETGEGFSSDPDVDELMRPHELPFRLDEKLNEIRAFAQRFPD